MKIICLLMLHMIGYHTCLSQHVSSKVDSILTSKIIDQINNSDSNNFFNRHGDNEVVAKIDYAHCIRVFGCDESSNINDYHFKGKLTDFLVFDTTAATYYFYRQDNASKHIVAISGPPFDLWYPLDLHDTTDITELIDSIDLEKAVIFRFGMIKHYFIEMNNQVFAFVDGNLVEANKYLSEHYTNESFLKMFNLRW